MGSGEREIDVQVAVNDWMAAGSVGWGVVEVSVEGSGRRSSRGSFGI